MKYINLAMILLAVSGCNPGGGPSAITPSAASAPTTHTWKLRYESTGGAKRVAVNFRTDVSHCEGTPGCNGGLGANGVWPTFHEYNFPGERLLYANILLWDGGGYTLGVGNPVEATLYRDGIPVEAVTLTNFGDYHDFGTEF